MNVIISQSMATGLPVIVTNHSGLSEQVSNSINGFVVSENNPKELAEAIIKFINQKDSWTKMSLESRKIAQNKYNSDLLIDRQIDIYKSLILK